MQLTRFLLIVISIGIAAYFTFQLQIWAGEFRNLFFYLSDWKSWVAIMAFVYAAGGIIKWILMEEVALTRPRPKRVRRRY